MAKWARPKGAGYAGDEGQDGLPSPSRSARGRERAKQARRGCPGPGRGVPSPPRLDLCATLPFLRKQKGEAASEPRRRGFIRADTPLNPLLFPLGSSRGRVMYRSRWRKDIPPLPLPHVIPAKAGTQARTNGRGTAKHHQPILQPPLPFFKSLKIIPVIALKPPPPYSTRIQRSPKPRLPPTPSTIGC